MGHTHRENSGKYCSYSGQELVADHYSEQRDDWTEYSCNCPVHQAMKQLKELQDTYEETKKVIEEDILKKRKDLFKAALDRMHKCVSTKTLLTVQEGPYSDASLDLLKTLYSSIHDLFPDVR